MDSITGRTMIMLVVGLGLSHLASSAMLAGDHQDRVQAMGERIAVAARALDHAPPSERPRLAADLGSDTLAVSLATASAQKSGTDMPHQLSDGTWVNFHMAAAVPSGLLSPHAMASALVMMGGIVLFGFLATGWIGRPLATFATAADRLGRDVNAPPLPEDGPREMRHAVAAFNQMQDRIRRFVEDRTRMLAAISHDLRSPITRLRLRAELLADGEVRRRMLADLDEMETMVASALDFARGEAADEPTQTIDLAATIETICDNATDMGLAASYAWDSRLLCTCRPMALKRALTNLVENAARYGQRASVRSRRLGNTIEVVIEDDGPGIADAELEKVFIPFYRLEGSRNRKTGGVGLGMTVARTIVRGHGGDVRLDNRAEGGLRVIVVLPQDAQMEGSTR